MNGNLENMRPRADMIPRIEHHMAQARIPKGIVIDMREGDQELWSHIKSLFLPLGPKHIFNNERLPVEPAAKKELQRLQNVWGTGPNSFPAMIFTSKGTMEFNIEWAMVRAEDFEKTSEELVTLLKRAQEDVGVQDVEHWIRSLEFVYTAVIGERPPGSTAPAPLQKFPARTSF